MSAAQGAFLASSPYLEPGQVFKAVEGQDDGLKCTIRIQLLKCDLQNGNLSGTIQEDRKQGIHDCTAFDIAKTWEGKIMDNRNWTFERSKFNENGDFESEKWNGLPEFRPIPEELQNKGGSDASLDPANSNYVFMRLREGELRKISIAEEKLLFDFAAQTHYACLKELAC